MGKENDAAWNGDDDDDGEGERSWNVFVDGFPRVRMGWDPWI